MMQPPIRYRRRGVGGLLLLRIFGGPMLLVLLVLLLVVPSACQEIVTGNGGTGPTTTLPVTVAVERVVDGDTIVVSGYGPKRETVRLTGVDTPETVHPNRPVQCWGPQASAYTKRQLPPGTVVYLQFERKPDGSPEPKGLRDRTPGRRLLAYVFRSRSLSLSTMVNWRLVQLGYAKASYFPPNDDYRRQFEAVQREASTPGKDGRTLGRWAHCPH